MSTGLQHSGWVIRDEARVDIYVGPGARRLLPRVLEELGREYTLVALVADAGLPGCLVSELAGLLEDNGFRAVTRILGRGEEAKTLGSITELWRWLLDVGADRWSLLVAYGGGAVSDAAGFAAATYMRGIDWAVLPTTLLSMVDAAVGGKTGINLGAKNTVGAFHHPRLVVADTEHLETLSSRDYVSGLAEVVKHALLEGRWFLDWLLEHRVEILERRHPVVSEMIRYSLDAKMRIVSRDFRERRGDRMLLNLGHTTAHAVEKATQYSIRHGEAVAIGLVVEAYLAKKLAGLPGEEVSEIRRTLSLFRLPDRPPAGLDPVRVLALIGLDKKKRGGRIAMPLLRGIGDPVIVELGVEEAKRLLAEAWREASTHEL